jgi:aspartate 1-decarboxylase
MLISTLKSKISYATVTDKNLYYVGSITIDKTIMEAARIHPNEKVQVVNLNNGARLETYVIEGKANSESIALNGPAARQCEIGDSLFILSYAMIDPDKETLTPALISMKPEETE